LCRAVDSTSAARAISDPGTTTVLASSPKWQYPREGTNAPTVAQGTLHPIWQTTVEVEPYFESNKPLVDLQPWVQFWSTTPPASPRSKAKVEAGVLIAQRWILARLRSRTFSSLTELNNAVAELVEELNTRNFKKLPGTAARRSRRSTGRA
jgi:hypothetical protein